MAYVHSARVHVGLGDRFAALVKTVQDFRLRRAMFNQTRRELLALSDRDLSDLGLNRTMIDEVAATAAYGQ